MRAYGQVLQSSADAAATTGSLATHCFRGFWDKQRWPNQMWLDGLYMAEPFYAQYAAMVHDKKAFDDTAHQFIWTEKHTRDPQTGLIYQSMGRVP
jgi:rhamnogalacturonyl hydrolase YesR